jgi:CRP/FNR family transcriptional regulator, cyclic AMP receptor protein
MKNLSASYDPAAALEFFKAGGKVAKLPQGDIIFSENKKKGLLGSERMFLLLEGEVSLLTGKRLIGGLKAGEIFGEMAALTEAPRSATAVAKTACRVIGLNDREFKAALKKKPGFALMMMSVMIARLRETLARLKVAGAIPENASPKQTAIFNPRDLADIVRGLSSDETVFYMQGRTIMQEGQTATRMYAVLEGQVAVSMGGKMVERVGPGGVVGELALLDQSTRLATAIAETDCTLQPINRNALLALVKLKPGLGLDLLSALADRLRLLTAKLKA